jgi:hypothetical protein
VPRWLKLASALGVAVALTAPPPVKTLLFSIHDVVR